MMTGKRNAVQFWLGNLSEMGNMKTKEETNVNLEHWELITREGGGEK
jgi:hypothetical protein